MLFVVPQVADAPQNKVPVLQSTTLTIKELPVPYVPSSMNPPHVPPRAAQFASAIEVWNVLVCGVQFEHAGVLDTPLMTQSEFSLQIPPPLVTVRMQLLPLTVGVTVCATAAQVTVPAHAEMAPLKFNTTLFQLAG